MRTKTSTTCCSELILWYLSFSFADPSPPLQLRVTTQNSTSLSISWTSPNDTNKDHYQYNVLLSKDMELVTNTTMGQTNYTFTNLSPGTDYNVSVLSLYHGRKSQATVKPDTTSRYRKTFNWMMKLKLWIDQKYLSTVKVSLWTGNIWG